MFTLINDIYSVTIINQPQLKIELDFQTEGGSFLPCPYTINNISIMILGTSKNVLKNREKKIFFVLRTKSKDDTDTTNEALKQLCKIIRYFI